MNIISRNIIVRNESLILTNQRALYWEREKALILSDIHIGKTAHFRRYGIPIPDDVMQRDLSRLEALITHFNPAQLLVVGDLFHAERNSNINHFASWLKTYKALPIILIKGNHDRLSEGMLRGFDIQIVNKLVLDPFTFLHEHSDLSPDAFVISGHVHPGVLIKGKGKQKIKLPCYQVSEKQLILPAFSLFTGLNTTSEDEKITSYAFTDEQIYQL